MNFIYILIFHQRMLLTLHNTNTYSFCIIAADPIFLEMLHYSSNVTWFLPLFIPLRATINMPIYVIPH